MPSTNKLRHPFPKRTREPSITISDKLFAQTVELPDLINIELCKISRREIFTASHKMHHFVSLSTKTQILSFPRSVLGNLTIKSNVTVSQGFAGTGIGCNAPKGLWRRGLCFWHKTHQETYLETSFVRDGHQNNRPTTFLVLSIP